MKRTCFMITFIILQSIFLNTTFAREPVASNDKNINTTLQGMKLAKGLPAHRLNAIKGDISFSQGNYFEAQKYYKRVINDTNVRDSLNLLMRMEFMLMLSFDRMEEYSLIAHSIEDFETSALRVGNKAYLAAVPFFKGKIAYYSGETEKGYKLMKQAIDMMKHAGGSESTNYLMYFNNNFLKMLQKDRMPDRALATLKELEAFFAPRPGGQQSIAFPYEVYLKEYYGCRAITLQRIGHEEEATQWYNKFLSMQHIYIYDYKSIEYYLFEKRLYDDVIRFGHQRLDHLAAVGDTLNPVCVTIYRLMARAYTEKGLYKEAINYYGLMDKANEELTRLGELSAVDEMSANYTTYIAELDKQHRKHTYRLVNVLVIVAIIIIMSSLISLRTMHYNRIIRKKNLSLVKTIDELMRVRRAAYQTAPASPDPSEGRGEQSGSTFASPLPSEGLGEAALQESIADACAGPRKSMESITEYQERKKFARMNHDIVEKKLFLDPTLTRTTLLEKYNIPRNNFSPMFQKFTGTSYSKYINNLRLEEAAKMLKEQPNYTVESIANDCGIPSVATLYRLFSQKYGMTPTEYRQTVLLSDTIDEDEDDE